MEKGEVHTNAVRQILMNELGLTRESIKEEMEEIIEKTARLVRQPLYKRKVSCP